MDMKKFQTEYSENSITYSPAYEAGRVGTIMVLVLGSLFIATSIWTLLDNPSGETHLEIQVALPVVMVILCFILGFIFRTMRTKIIVSNKGIECFKNNVVAEKQIIWENVSAVYFCQELWYGRKSCKIFFKNTTHSEPNKKDKCDFVLPVCSVDEQKLLQFIPVHLWENKPWYS